MLIARIERKRKEAARSPLETVLAPVMGFDRRRAVTIENVDDSLEQMTLRRGRSPRSDIEHEQRHEIAASLQVNGRAVGAEPRPWSRAHRKQVDSEILDDGHALILNPGQIRIEQ